MAGLTARHLLAPDDLVEWNELVEALELVGPARLEAEALPDAQLAHRGRHEDRAGGRVVTRPRGQLHRRAEQVVALGHRLARAHADPDPDRMLGAARLMVVERTLDRDRALDRARHRRERGHDPVAGV